MMAKTYMEDLGKNYKYGYQVFDINNPFRKTWQKKRDLKTQIKEEEGAPVINKVCPLYLYTDLEFDIDLESVCNLESYKRSGV